MLFYFVLFSVVLFCCFFEKREAACNKHGKNWSFLGRFLVGVLRHCDLTGS